VNRDTTRLPSFNDFSPGIIGDIRECLRIVADHQGDRATSVNLFAQRYFEAKINKRSQINLPASLGPKGLALVDLESWSLTDLGRRVLEAPNALTAIRSAVEEVLQRRNGDLLLQAVKRLEHRGHTGNWKEGLKTELKDLGVTDLARATTDHTTLANWLVAAGYLRKEGRSGYAVNEDEVAVVLGVSMDDRLALHALPTSHKVVLRALRSYAEVHGAGFVAVREVLDPVLSQFPGLLPEDQLSGQLLQPLRDGGFIELTGRTAGRGSKSGSVRPTDKLLSIPPRELILDIDEGIPSDLRTRLLTPSSEIEALLESTSTGDRGLGLELLVLRMLLDLGLVPTGFRQRSRDTAHAEIDLMAEGSNLVFSRWTVQCKCHRKHPVGLSSVAKEVGIAIHQKAHVVCVVTTTTFTSGAIAYASQIQKDTHLQFLMIGGDVVYRYLREGRRPLLDFVINNATDVMAQKSSQVSPIRDGDDTGPS